MVWFWIRNSILDMKLTTILISILIFFISGVMFLFSNSEVFAQNNARREFKFYQENIKSKKKIMNYRKQEKEKIETIKVKINFV